MKPLVIDLFCGLGGWSRAFLDEGWECLGFDIERHDYGTGGYPGQLVLQDVLTLDGRQFRGRAALIVASPPCQEFSYMAMPWSRGKQIAAALRGEADFPENYQGSRTIEELCALFNACFRIAGEAEVPLVVENVRGAEPWVGNARWYYGSFYFWGDVPALMPLMPMLGQAEGSKVPGFRFDGSGKSFQSASVNGVKNGAETRDEKYRLTQPRGVEGTKLGGSWFHSYAPGVQGPRNHSSRGSARKAASAMIAMIPYPVASHIARVFNPKEKQNEPTASDRETRRLGRNAGQCIFPHSLPAQQ